MLTSARETLLDYASKVRLFRLNARLYLANVILSGVAMGVFRLLFNFYALSLGFDEALLGRLITVSSLTSLLVALPMGYLADILGRKNSLVLSSLLVSGAIIGMIFVPSRDGVSHAPSEYTSPEQITNGANVLLHTVLGMDELLQ